MILFIFICNFSLNCDARKDQLHWFSSLKTSGREQFITDDYTTRHT